MKRIIILLLLAIPLYLSAQEESSHLRFSLLTCTSGDDISSAFGHSAIRLVDSTKKNDIVFNYGTFSFEEPHFVLKFMRGELDYMLSINYYRNFKESYKREGRGISERVINLTESQKVSLYAFLMDNYKPENRFYRYDFMIDNCATRIRDIFNGEDFTYTDTPTGMTYREELRNLYIHDKWWLRFGTDLLLGSPVDKLISTQEEMFLPCNLERNLALYDNKALSDSTGSLCLLGEEVVLQEAAPERSKFIKVLTFITQPTIVFTLLAVALFFLFVKIPNRKALVRSASVVFFLILGLGGALLTFMWFGTEHTCTKPNWNLLWMDPLFLIPVCMPSNRVRRIITRVLAAIALVTVILWWVIPQYFNTAVIPIVAIVFLLAAFEMIINQKYR